MPLQAYHYNLTVSVFSKLLKYARKILKNLIPSLIVAIFLTAILRTFSILLGLEVLIPLITGVGSVIITIIRSNILNLAITLKKCIFAFFLGVILSCFVIYLLKPFILNLLLHKDIGLEIFIPILINDLYISISNMNRYPHLDPLKNPFDPLSDDWWRVVFSEDPNEPNNDPNLIIPDDNDDDLNGPNSSSDPIIIPDDDDDLIRPNSSSDPIIIPDDDDLNIPENTNEANENPNLLESFAEGYNRSTEFSEGYDANEEYNASLLRMDDHEEYNNENITESCNNNHDLNTDLLRLKEQGKGIIQEKPICTRIADPYPLSSKLDVIPPEGTEMTPVEKSVYVKNTKGIVYLYEEPKPVKPKAKGIKYISAIGEYWIMPKVVESFQTDLATNCYNDHLKTCVKAYPIDSILNLEDSIFNNPLFNVTLNIFRKNPDEDNLKDVRNMILHHYFREQTGYMMKALKHYNTSVIGTLYPSRIEDNLEYAEDETHVKDDKFNKLVGFNTAIVNTGLSSNNSLMQQVKSLNSAMKDLNKEMKTNNLSSKYIIMITGDTEDKNIYLRFFIYQNNYHRFNLNIHKDIKTNGYLGLYVNDKGIEIMPQEKSYKAQCIRYNLSNPSDLLCIHAIFTYIKNVPFRPVLGHKLILKDIPTVGHPLHHSHIIAKDVNGNNVILGHNGQIRTIALRKEDNIARSMEDNWLNTYGSSQAQSSSRASIRDNLREINKRNGKGREDSIFNMGFNKRSKK